MMHQQSPSCRCKHLCLGCTYLADCKHQGTHASDTHFPSTEENKNTLHLCKRHRSGKDRGRPSRCKWCLPNLHHKCTFVNQHCKIHGGTLDTPSLCRAHQPSQCHRCMNYQFGCMYREHMFPECTCGAHRISLCTKDNSSSGPHFGRFLHIDKHRCCGSCEDTWTHVHSRGLRHPWGSCILRWPGRSQLHCSCHLDHMTPNLHM